MWQEALTAWLDLARMILTFSSLFTSFWARCRQFLSRDKAFSSLLCPSSSVSIHRAEAIRRPTPLVNSPSQRHNDQIQQWQPLPRADTGDLPSRPQSMRDLSKSFCRRTCSSKTGQELSFDGNDAAYTRDSKTICSWPGRVPRSGVSRASSWSLWSVKLCVLSIARA